MVTLCFFVGSGGAGGAAVSNAGAIGPFVNGGEIRGGAGGAGDVGSLGGGAAQAGAGGAGVVNAAMIASLSNSGMIAGGNGGSATGAGGRGGAGGAGIANSGTITTLTNSGTIEGGAGGAGAIPGAAGDAIYSAGKHASIGAITNSGQIIGNVEIDNQASVTVAGGSGKTFGTWTGGSITIGDGNLTFVSGNTGLGDDISVDGGKGTVTNMGALKLATPETIAGNFTQSAAGVLGLDFAGDVSGQYGALTVSKLTTLDGGLAIDLTDGFTLAKGDSFDILNFGGLAGPASTRSRSMARPAPQRRADMWTCGGGVRLKEVIDPTSLDLFVAHGSSAFGPAGSSPIPEPSTWAMLALGFLGLGGLGPQGAGKSRPELGHLAEQLNWFGVCALWSIELGAAGFRWAPPKRWRPRSAIGCKRRVLQAAATTTIRQRCAASRRASRGTPRRDATCRCRVRRR